MRKFKYWELTVLIVLLIGTAVWWATSQVKDPTNNTDSLDRSEEIEKARLNNFFTELDRIYGYLYTSEDESIQLFIKIDEALHQGELTGSLLMMVNTDPYEETSYVLNGITDGLMVQFFTSVDGKETKLEGNFHEDALSFDLSFWTTDIKLPFNAVTEEEFEMKTQR